MSKTELDRLIADLQRHPDLMAELRRLIPDLDRMVRWVAEKGYRVTLAELRQLLDSDRELSDDELEEAAGGEDGWTPPPPPPPAE
ncbi:MAG TPA: Nif11-like leader peptide family RiPP precursor [Thermoanaerobaculia bacterium]|nr:Nif11-like leader peptide family RiPP precursor [Thermoanaerobaculia bacterium]